MNILALDTSTEACSLALWLDGRICEWHERIPRQHADQILDRLTGLMADAGTSLSELDAIAFGRGPGSFTGLRIATGVAQGLAYGLDIPVLPVSTLATLASQAFHETGHQTILACLDARINEIYWAAYSVSEERGPLALCNEQLTPPEVLDIVPLIEKAGNSGWFGYGNGWSYIDRLPTPVTDCVREFDDSPLPRASAMLPLALAMYKRGELTSAAHAVPVYLRDQVTREP